MLFRILFFLLIPLFLMGAEPQVTEGEPPSWVKSCDFSLQPLPIKPSQAHLQYLLIDTQTNWEEKAFYSHVAVKANTPMGVNEIARLDFSFSPSTETLCVHCIRIFRNGQWIDKLKGGRHALLQREPHLEFNLYHGTQALVYFLEDVREGDILEYAYSTAGEIPFFSSHLTGFFFLQSPVAIERIYRRILARPDCSFMMKPFNTDVEPQVADLPGLREWSWELNEVAACPEEERQPAWYQPLSRVQFSQYRNWEEVAQKLYPLFELPDGFDMDLEMRSWVERWESTARTAEERALLALRFVQDEVRYMGFEEGIWGFKPVDPRTVLQRRYGDCKDKTFLLHAFLRMMGIESTPVVVNSSRGKNLPDLLPSPFVFDHVILRIEIEAREYWVDSTFQFQGGSSLKENFFPHFFLYGLPLSPSTRELVSLPTAFDDRPIEIQTSILVKSIDCAEMKIQRKFIGMKADLVRRFLKWTGMQNLSENGLHAYNKIYGNVSFVHPITMDDDREKNILVLNETVNVPSLKRVDKRALKVFSLAILNFLDSWMNPNRSAPYALFYPNWVKEHTHFENPFETYTDESFNTSFDHGSFCYSRSMKKGGHSIDMIYELKHLKDHIPVDALKEYWEAVKQVELDVFFQVLLDIK